MAHCPACRGAKSLGLLGFQPLAHDFDLSSLVSGKLVAESAFDSDEFPGFSTVERQAGRNLSEVRGGYREAAVARALEQFAGRREAMLGALEEAPVDPEGRVNIAQHIQAFYRMLPVASGRAPEEDAGLLDGTPTTPAGAQ